MTTTIRLVEVLAALSLASDLGHDQPLEKSLRNAVIAARLGEELGPARRGAVGGVLRVPAALDRLHG